MFDGFRARPLSKGDQLILKYRKEINQNMNVAAKVTNFIHSLNTKFQRLDPNAYTITETEVRHK